MGLCVFDLIQYFQLRLNKTRMTVILHEAINENSMVHEYYDKHGAWSYLRISYDKL